MKPSDAAAFKELLGGVYSFYRQELTKFHIDVWWQAMKNYSLEGVRDALNRHVMNPDNGQFLPKPADVVKLIDGGTQERALVAWSKVDAAVTGVGQYSTVVFDDAHIHEVLHDMGGWVHLCSKRIDEWPFVKNEFVNRYRGASMRAATNYPAKLVGLTEAHNAADHAKYVPPPKYVGDEARARQVMIGGQVGGALRHSQIGNLLPDMVKLLEKRA